MTQLSNGDIIEYYPHLTQGSYGWLYERKKCDMGSSELGAMLGISRFCSRRQKFKIKNGEASAPPPNEFMASGSYWEDIVVRNVAPFYAPVKLERYGMLKYRSVGGLTIGCSPDRVACAPDGTWLAAIEVKTHQRYYEGVRLEHIPQMLMQCVCLQVPVAHYVVQVLEEPLDHAVIYELTFDDDLWPKLLTLLEQAWKKCKDKDYSQVKSTEKDAVLALLERGTTAKLWYKHGLTREQCANEIVSFYN